jgi:hypothetical protein
MLSTTAQVARTVTDGVAANAPSARIQVRRIPDISPPIIDSRAATQTGVWDRNPFVQGTLAISFDREHEALPDLCDHDDPAYFEPQRTLSQDLPEPKAWVRCMAQALIEVMSAARPAAQLIRWTTPEVYAVVARRHAVSGRRRTLVVRRAIVRRVMICEPVDGVVEGCAVVVDNGRVRALAMRLTGLDGRWVISELQVG